MEKDLSLRAGLAVLPFLALVACKAEKGAEPIPLEKHSTADGRGSPPAMGDPANNPDMTEFAKEVDTNGDGKMSWSEWQAKGLPPSSFKMFEHGRGYVTLDDFKQNAAPPGIDLNGDGKLTVQEFKDFDRQMSTKPKPAKTGAERP